MDGFEEISFRISYIDRFWGNPFGKNISQRGLVRLEIWAVWNFVLFEKWFGWKYSLVKSIVWLEGQFGLKYSLVGSIVWLEILFGLKYIVGYSLIYSSIWLQVWFIVWFFVGLVL